MITFWIACFLWGCFSMAVCPNKATSVSLAIAGAIGLTILREYGL